MYLLLSYGHVTNESSELNGSCDSWVHVRVESGLFANEIEKSSLEIQYKRLKSLTYSYACIAPHVHVAVLILKQLSSVESARALQNTHTGPTCCTCIRSKLLLTL